MSFEYFAYNEAAGIQPWQDPTDIIQRALAESTDTEYALQLIQTIEIAYPPTTDQHLTVKKSQDNHLMQNKRIRQTINQTRYIGFQIRQRKLANHVDCIQQAKIVAIKHNDMTYAKLLLNKAQRLIKKTRPFDLQAELNLICAADALFNDDVWLKSLLDDCAERIQDTPQICQLGESLIQELQDKTFAMTWVRDLHQRWQNRLIDESAPSHTFEQLAWAVWQQLQDKAWAKQLLEKAYVRANTPSDLVSLGYTARRWELHGEAEAYYREAANQCTESKQLVRLFQQLQRFKEPDGLLGYLYQQTERRQPNTINKLHWADDIVQAFGDAEWTNDIYRNLRATLAREQM